jgi:hypothetical protein
MCGRYVMSKATGDLLGHFEAREVEGCASADSSPHKKSRRVVYSIADGHLTRLVMEGLNHADHKVAGEPAHD